ncbi:MAG: nucleotidyltransferase domain-containing protein [Oceanospirillaceae bacterium]|nr:nucleotidyltransferase domain-containing protein [Oceanospirillaceae bacterium]
MDFQQIKSQILELASADQSIDALWLYGSHAKGNSGENSDVDLAVLFSADEADLLARRLRPELLALEWCEKLRLAEGKLSILDMQTAAIPLSMGVLQTGQLLLNKSPNHEFRVSRSIMSKWEIDYEYHYKHMD